MNILKQLFCSHDFQFVRNIYGDEIIGWGYKRSVWQCTKCRKVQGRDKLRDTNVAGPAHLAPQPAPGLEFDHRGVLVPASAETPPPIAWASDALRDVAAERRRQIEGEGWTPEHDDEHTRGQLVQTAADLCLDGTDFRVVDPDGDRMLGWGLTERHHNDRRRQLVIAGALILAEIERLDRA